MFVVFFRFAFQLSQPMVLRNATRTLSPKKWQKKSNEKTDMKTTSKTCYSRKSNAFTVNSHLICPKCNVQVHVGTGGQDNGDDMPDAQPELTVQPEDVGTRQSSGRVRKRTEVNSRCECNTLITLEEKEIGTQVMECKARGCETGWVRVICFYFRPTLT